MNNTNQNTDAATAVTTATGHDDAYHNNPAMAVAPVAHGTEVGTTLCTAWQDGPRSAVGGAADVCPSAAKCVTDCLCPKAPF